MLAEFPFDSTRKRMSLLIETEGQYYLMTKGADNIMFEKCVFFGKEDQALKEKTIADLY